MSSSSLFVCEWSLIPFSLQGASTFRHSVLPLALPSLQFWQTCSWSSLIRSFSLPCQLFFSLAEVCQLHLCSLASWSCYVPQFLEVADLSLSFPLFQGGIGGWQQAPLLGHVSSSLCWTLNLYHIQESHAQWYVQTLLVSSTPSEERSCHLIPPCPPNLWSPVPGWRDQFPKLFILQTGLPSSRSQLHSVQSPF